MYRAIVVIAFLISLTAPCDAQEEVTAINYGRKYIDLNLRSLDKYNERIQKGQKKLLNKLVQKEKKLYSKLKRGDSASYAQLASNSLSYDSIRTLLNADSSSKLDRTKNKTNAAVDSLKKVQHFLQGKASHISSISAGLTSDLPVDQTSRLNSLQTDLNYNNYINQLIDQKTNSLKNLEDLQNSKLFKGIQKEVFYGKAKMSTWKDIANDPDKAEEKALEWLQGTQDFDQAFKQQGGMQSASSVEDLERIGYQTKRMMNEHLQKQFGSNLSQVQEQMGKQVGDWQQQTQGLSGKLNEVKQQVSSACEQLKEGKQTLNNAKHIKKPAFKVNPMRGLPFRERIEKSYSYQTRRSTPDGKQPAMLELAAMAGYKHTPKLITGVGLAANIGLGQNWNNIRLSLQGIGVRTFAQWEWQYGIAAYAGYERQYKQISSWQLAPADANNSMQPTTHNTKQYSETVLLGLSKQYKLNSNWSGAMQVLYDVWWKDKGLRSPVVLRFVTSKK